MVARSKYMRTNCRNRCCRVSVATVGKCPIDRPPHAAPRAGSDGRQDCRPRAVLVFRLPRRIEPPSDPRSPFRSTTEHSRGRARPCLELWDRHGPHTDARRRGTRDPANGGTVREGVRGDAFGPTLPAGFTRSRAPRASKMITSRPSGGISTRFGRAEPSHHFTRYWQRSSPARTHETFSTFPRVLRARRIPS